MLLEVIKFHRFNKLPAIKISLVLYPNYLCEDMKNETNMLNILVSFIKISKHQIFARRY